MTLWQSYSADLKQRGLTNPYPDEEAFNRAYGIVKPNELLVIIPRHEARYEKEHAVESLMGEAKAFGLKSVEEWYDYHETMRLLSRIKRGAMHHS